MLSLQGHHSFALYLYIVSGWDFISLRQVQLFLFPFLRPLSAQMLSGPDVRTRQHFNSWFGPIRQQTKSNRFFFLSLSTFTRLFSPVHRSVFYPQLSVFVTRLLYKIKQCLLFFSSVVPSLSSSFLLSSFPSLLCLPSPPCFTQPTLRTFYSVQNINLSSRGVITLSSRAAAALFKCCLFFFSSICFHFTSLPQYLLPPFLFSPLVSIS